jgi:uncharacterized protein with HEPN domain
MNERDQALLNDMLDFSKRISRRVDGKQFEDLATDEYALGDMLVRPLLVIGEAANHVTADLKREHPEIAWSDMIGMRNRMIHDYTRIEWRIVWKVATEDIPLLTTQLQSILNEES